MGGGGTSHGFDDPIIPVIIDRVIIDSVPPIQPVVRFATSDPAGPDDLDLTEVLLRAAIDEFAAKGLDKAGVAAIARRAGVTTGAIYSRWTGKQEMILDAVDEVMSQHLDQLLTSRSDPSAPEILAALGADLVDPTDDPADAVVMEAFAAARRDPEFGEMLRRRLSDQEGRLALVIEEGKVAGVIDPVLSTESIVALCLSMGLGFTMFRAVDRPLPAADEWNTVIARLIAAALPVPSPSSPPIH